MVSSRLRLDFPVAAFTSPGAMLWRALTVYLGNFSFIAIAALVGYGPLKFAVFFLCDQAGIVAGSATASLVRDLADMLLSALVAPTVIYGLLARLRGGQIPSVGECLGWGRQRWGRTLWNDIKASVTIGLRLLLFIIPGIIAMVQLCFVEVVVAIEADTQPAPLERSRDIAKGHGWRIFFVLLPAAALSLIGDWALYSAVGKLGVSWPAVASLDCVLTVLAQYGTVLLTLMYLALSKEVERGAV
jgi:hypothetical protein